MKAEPPGDDICPTPAPVDEDPPHDRFCDLVLTGGVASGVVYPWAVVELARAYRFRNIGGSSVGAMAAALAAAAEYGRRTGVDAAFEPLRRLPGALGEELADGRTRMLSLFQPSRQGRRLLGLWARLGRGARASRAGLLPSWVKVAGEVIRAYAVPVGLGAIVGALAGWVLTHPPGLRGLVVMALLALGAALAALVLAVAYDIRCGVIANNLGLCKGGTLEPQNPDKPTPGLSEWLHEGIQGSAGLKLSDPPLTFRDLWCAPIHPGAAATRCTEDDPPQQRAINLQVITTNVTHGRPYRLPLADRTSRLFFRPGELRPYLPRAVLRALVAVAPRYAPSPTFNSDPPTNGTLRKFRELPGADMPIVVAARLSLSFPLLFSAVTLYAIDYEMPDRAQRTLKRCRFTDGGVSSNFPIHIFDAVLPAWPTFGLWLDTQGPYSQPDDDPVWLPELHLEGWADNWNRFDPDTHAPWKLLAGFLGGLVTTAKDWRDRTAFRMPHVRNRVARLWLRQGEGGLHIGMSRAQILNMAHRYGTTAGLRFVDYFCGADGEETDAWREQRWVRLQVLLAGIRERLNGLSAAAGYASHCVPMHEAIDAATRKAPLRDKSEPAASKLTLQQADSLHTLLADLERLEGAMRTAEPMGYKPLPEPELRLRAPL